MDWNNYLHNTKDAPPRPLLCEAISHAKGPRALDLGSGAFNDTKHLIANNFLVTAVDSVPEARALSLALPIVFFSSPIEKLEFLSKYDLVSAQYILPFIEGELIPKVLECVDEGGVFTGQFFGQEDAWADNVLTHSEEQIRTLFKDFEILKLEEEKGVKPTALQGDKFWHIFHVIARRN